MIFRATQLLVALVATTVTAGAAVDFETHIRPLLVERCASCHGEKKQKALLRLDRRADALKGGENGPVIIPGRAADSPLFQRITSTDDEDVMPPLKADTKRLTPAEIAALRQWIADGAPWPDDGSVADTFALAKDHWAFAPPRKAPVPPGAHPIDFFLGEKHRELGLTPAPPADTRTLTRRLTFDLTGLPPTPDEIAAFESDSIRDPQSAIRNLSSRLLASPRHGERWGRFWLDLARWAESDGYEANEVRPAAWRYRDYVVAAFNADTPYDVFLREQLAGDELTPLTNDRLVATGFLAAARINNNEEDKALQLHEPLVDIANTTASVTLGLTLACAQCHDHKFEALTIRDYYSLHGLFVRGQVNSLLLHDPAGEAAWKNSRPPEIDAAKKEFADFTAPVRARLREEARAKKSQPARTAATDEANSAEVAEADAAPAAEINDFAVRKALSSPDQKKFTDLKKKIADLERAYTDRRPQTWGYYSPATSPHAVGHIPPRGQYPFPYKPAELKTAQPAVLKRGSLSMRGDPVEPAAPAIVGGAKFSNRREFADWLASDANPLTARVWANFVWQQHFGRGLVATPGDFGVKGARPSNQPLLDWLACELREHSWSTKHLHRLIVTSAAYRRAAVAYPATTALDPENIFLTRWLPRRLEAEAIRDSMLAVAGKLDLSAGGPSDPPEKPTSRRSLYQLQPRFKLPPGQALFDAPTANESCPQRHVSTVPLQPLHLLNDATNVALATAFADRVRTLAGDDHAAQITTAFRLALTRDPDATERARAEKFFALSDATPETTLADFCQAVLNLNEFVYVP